MSELYKLRQHDLIKGAITAVFAAIITVMYGVVSQADFNLFTADWAHILSEMLQVSFTAFVAYLGKNFLTDSEGRVAGVL